MKKILTAMRLTFETEQPKHPDSPWQHVYDVTISPAAVRNKITVIYIECKLLYIKWSQLIWNPQIGVNINFEPQFGVGNLWSVTVILISCHNI